ncbi:glycine zipper 2TM domain-containing protein [Hydrogenophaga sp. 2FB]|uniref:glycine zipper 2TM domain-containing protein n=1 Tax=Hydrogenophaga sp. 2FB TaxID=2502187 RepID=UPI001BB2A1A9|nr:glycine zipper 2TM domain-containing protein [Hydrogenophaga sp. 2FB]
MKTPVLVPVMTGLLALAGSGVAHAQEEQGRVISSTPIVQQVAVPREVCSDQQVTYEGQKSGAGALMGGIAGGAVGNAIGDGSGRAAATVIGLIGGAMLGNRIEGPGQPYTETYRQCGTQTYYDNRTVAYDVVYEYAGRQYRTQMAQDPGRYVRLNVSPADAMPPPPVQYQSYPSYPPQSQYVEPSTRITIGTTFYPHPGSVMPINGYRYGPGYMPPQRYVAPPPRWSRDRDHDRWERNR